MCTVAGLNIWLSLIIAFVAGCIAGFITGVIHTKCGIPAILAGILTQLALYSINLRILGNKANQALPAAKYNLIATMRNIPMAIVVIGLFVIAIIAILYWFFGTEMGHSIRATGCNEAMARANGINTNTRKIIGLILSNGVVALSGALLAQYQGFADINMGRGAIVIGLAAIFIGLAISTKIKPNFVVSLIGVVGGGVIYYLVYNFVIFLGLDTDLLKMLSAIIVALFLAVPVIKRKLFTKREEDEESC
jgi:putative ABC transport system permease protein